MKIIFNIKAVSAALLAVSLPFGAHTQTLPTNLPCGLQTREWIKQNTFDNSIDVANISYNSGRRYMYAYVDNPGNSVTCVYGGYVHSYTPNPAPSSPLQRPLPPSTWLTSLTTGATLMINAEHTVPQSFFNENLPMRGDIHHLFPTYERFNNDRGSYRFAEIPDNLTTLWSRQLSSQSSVPTSLIQEYSERGTVNGEIVYEPREDHKGKLARAILYFYTMYPTQAGSISSVAELSTLQTWHENFPPTAAEIERNNRIEQSQGNRNPYIDQPNWIYQAWCLTPTLPVEFLYLTAKAHKNEVELQWRVSESKVAYYDIERSADGTNDWTQLGRVASKSREGLQDYMFLDQNPLPQAYYRIKNRDTDGQTSYSKIVQVVSKMAPLSILRIFTSKDQNDLILELQNNREGDAAIHIYDLNGQLQSRLSRPLVSGINGLTLPIEDLTAGIYIIQIQQDRHYLTSKFVKR